MSSLGHGLPEDGSVSQQCYKGNKELINTVFTDITGRLKGSRHRQGYHGMEMTEAE